MDIEAIQKFQQQFSKERDWDQFHTPKNLSMALSAEVGELLEIFQWLTADESTPNSLSPKKLQDVSEELSDILYYVIRIAGVMGIDLEKSIWSKMKENAQKYPVNLAKGNARKYTELREETD
jgi:dCTP diphosphatase